MIEAMSGSLAKALQSVTSRWKRANIKINPQVLQLPTYKVYPKVSLKDQIKLALQFKAPLKKAGFLTIVKGAPFQRTCKSKKNTKPKSKTLIQTIKKQFKTSFIHWRKIKLA